MNLVSSFCLTHVALKSYLNFIVFKIKKLHKSIPFNIIEFEMNKLGKES